MCGKLLRGSGHGGDQGRAAGAAIPCGGGGPFAHDQPDPEGRPALRLPGTAGKQSVVLDLHDPAERDRLLGLVGQVDVLIESFDPGTLDSLGPGSRAAERSQSGDSILNVHHRVRADRSLSRLWRGPDIVGLATGGFTWASAAPLSLPPGDATRERRGFYFASTYATFGTVLALWRRATRWPGAHGGCGRAGVHGLPREHHPHLRLRGVQPGPRGQPASPHRPRRPVPRQRWIRPPLHRAGRTGSSSSSLWPRLTHGVGRPGSGLPNHVRRAATAWLNAEGEPPFTPPVPRGRSWSRSSKKRACPGLPVNTPTDFLHDEQMAVPGATFQPTIHPVLGEYVQPTLPVLIDGRAGRRRPPTPPGRAHGCHPGEHLASRARHPSTRRARRPTFAIILAPPPALPGPHALAGAGADRGRKSSRSSSRQGGAG